MESLYSIDKHGTTKRVVPDRKMISEIEKKGEFVTFDPEEIMKDD